ncbi:MAG: hypothetical protein ABEJ78_03400 [Haloferacaceae archaeon]
MPSFGPFGGSSDQSGGFDDYEEFVASNVPEPGPFLAAGEVLTGEDHVRVHELARDLFEERGVYDMTFGYNLAKLNLDRRHPGAGYRYAEDGDVLLAEFTPTTEFCPQSEVLTKATFRAWNGLSEDHDYDLVKVAIHPMHHAADAINRELAEMAATYEETGSIPDEGNGGGPDAADSAPF